MSRTASFEYPRQLLAERAEVLSMLNQQELPETRGSVVDGAGTASHEQGIRIDSLLGTAELSIVDTTAFAPGGFTDAYGLQRVASYYSSDSSNARSDRLFTDPVLYKQLDMTNPNGCPAIRVLFDRDDTGWHVATIDKVRFFANYVGDRVSTPRDQRLAETEHQLTTELSRWMAEEDTKYHIGYIRSKDGVIHAQAPLRQWADFKNLQLLAGLYVDRSAHGVLSAGGYRKAQNHILGTETIPDTETAQLVLAQTMDTERHLINMLGVDDITKYLLSTEAFRTFCDAIISEQVDVRKITGIGRLIGLVEAHETERGTEVTAGGQTQIVHDWDEFLIGLLQRTDRGENTKAMRDRRVMAESIRRQREEHELRTNPISATSYRMFQAHADRVRARRIRFRPR